MKSKKILAYLAKHEPSDVAPAAMCYFAAHLKDAPLAKVNEFFVHWETGVREHFAQAAKKEEMQ